MSIGDMNYASAMSEGNSLSRSVAEHNESVRQNNQLLIQQWNATKSRDAKDTEKDKEIKGVQDAVGGVSSLSTVAQGYGRVKQLGLGGALKQDVSRLKQGGQAVVSRIQSAVSSPQPPRVDGIEVSGTESGGTADVQPSRATAPSSAPESTPAPSSTSAPAPAEATSTTGESGNVASDVSKVSDTEQISGKIMKGLKTAGTIGKVAGAGMGVISAVSGIDDIADGKFAKMDKAHKTGDALSTAGGLLDIASIFLPVLAPVGALVSTAGAITNTVNTIGDDKKKERDDASSEQNQLNQNNQSIETTPSFTSMSLVGSAQHSVTHSVAGTSGSF